MAPPAEDPEHEDPVSVAEASNNADAEEEDAELFDPNNPLQNQELIRLVRTAAGAELLVNSAVQRALFSGNWGSLLGAAPDALGRLGQCFVLSSDPLAASLVFPENSGLQYTSLRANLVHCSNLGRNAFRDAEARMKKVSLVAQAVCEPGGTIDSILEAVDDEDLAELDLPEQLAALKTISEQCIEDSRAIKEKVDAWGEFARSIHNACIYKDDDLGKDEKDIGDQIEVKELAVKMKQAQVDESKSQTNEYRRQLNARQGEQNRAEKTQGRGAWIDLGLAAGNAAIEGVKHYFNPWSIVSSLGSVVSTGRSKEASSHDIVSVETEDPLAQRDLGFVLAQNLHSVIHCLATLITFEHGSSDYHGVDWEGLCGHADRQKDINYILNLFTEVTRPFQAEHSAVTRQVRVAAHPAEKVAQGILSAVRNEQHVNRDTPRMLAEWAPVWRSTVNKAESDIANILEAGYEAVRKDEDKNQKLRAENLRARPMSRQEQRFENFRLAQKALFEAETRLVKRLDDEMKATEEFNKMELELKRLLVHKATMSEVKDIVGDCVKHLHYFCERLDELTLFFTHMQQFIEDMDRTRVKPLSQTATVTKLLNEKARGEGSEIAKLRQQKVAQRKLEQLRLKALELKGYYLVAQTMADTYTEVSAKYILPGVNTINRLSLPEAQKLTKDERAEKVSEVGDMARQAKEAVKRLANTRKKQLMIAMTENRGDIEELRTIEN